MSATLEASRFVQYLPGCAAGMVHGRTFPVHVYYTAQPQDSYLEAALTTTLQVNSRCC
jgi:pre-mRNA-splicing factor ATP-dependent RNA helicase DHX15/PRP43